MKRALANTNNHREEQHNRHAIFNPWFGQVTLAYFHVVASQLTRVALNPFQVIWWSTWIPRSFPFEYSSRLRGISTSWSLSPLQYRSQRKHKSKEGKSNTHKTQITANTRTQVKKLAHKHSVGSLQLKRCSILKNNDPIAWLQSLGVLECFLQAWCTSPCAGSLL